MNFVYGAIFGALVAWAAIRWAVVKGWYLKNQKTIQADVATAQAAAKTVAADAQAAVKKV